jgi:hypothetical protein
VTFLFTESAEGWFPFTLPVFTDPILAYNPNGTGSLDITATDNQSNFGFWQSPRFEMVVYPDRAQTDSIPLEVVELDGSNVYALDFGMIGDAIDQNEVPEIRMRTTAENSQQADVLVISSNSPNGISPYADHPSASTIYFMPAKGSPEFRLQFDMMNFDQLNDSKSAKVGLEFAEICNFSPIDTTDARIEAHFTFNESNEGWTTHSFEAYQPPTFEYDAVGGSLNLISGPIDDNFQFGYWGSPESGKLVYPEDGRLYFGEFTVVSDQFIAKEVPSFRMRINESGFRVAQYMQVASTGTSSNSPTVGNPKTYTVFFPPNIATDGAFLIYSFDLVTQQLDGDANATLSLNQLVIKSIPLRQ